MVSIYSSLNVGISGLNAQSNKLDVISDNIANVNTAGYKRVNANFQTLVAFESLISAYSPGGVVGSNKSQNYKQGEILGTTSTTDIAISGSGFFPVTQLTSNDHTVTNSDDVATTIEGIPASLNSLLYTRAGSFREDLNGDYINDNGFFLQAWPLDGAGNLDPALVDDELSASAAVAALRTVNVQSLTADPIATSEISIKANLKSSQLAHRMLTAYNAADNSLNMSGGNVTPTATQTVEITDSLNVTHDIVLAFLRTGTHSMAVEVYANPASDVTAANGLLASGTLTLDSGGNITAVSPALASILIDWQNGATDSTLTQNWATAVAALGITEIAYNPTSATANMATNSVQPHFVRTLNVIDSLGASHTVNAGFLKTGANTWAVELFAANADEVAGGITQIAFGNITFNGDGSLASVSSALTGALGITWTANADNVTPAPSSFTVNWGTAGVPFGTPNATLIGRTDGMRQLDTSYTADDTVQNGRAGGTIKSVSIGQGGYISGTFSDGSTRNLYKIPLVMFLDPDMLESVTGNVFRQSVNTSNPFFRQANENGAGKFLGSALELSTVDVASELTELIIAQRAYEANTKTVSTSDEMLQTLTQMLG